MKTNRKCIVFAGVAALTAAAGLARAEDAKVSGEVNLPVLSSYVWRGQTLNDKSVFQPNLTVSQYGFSLKAWANYNLDGSYGCYKNDDRNEFSQVVLAAAYATQVGPDSCPVSVGGGVIQYLFPYQTQALSSNGLGRAAPGTREVYAAVGLPKVLLAPTLQVNYDFDAADGFYANLGISQRFELAKDQVALVASASLGAGSEKYNDLYFGKSRNALNDGLVGLALPIALSKSVTLTPAVQYMFLPDSTIRDAADATYGHQDRFVGSLNLNYAF